MANSEKKHPQDLVHLYLAFRRRKDNPEGPTRCHRELIQDATSLDALKARCTAPGLWRIHKTVNARSTAKAAKILMHKLLDDPEAAQYLTTLWKTCLLQKESKAERRLMLDIDDPLRIPEVVDKLGLTPYTLIRSPSGGAHIICESLDTRLLEGIPDVTVLRDGYVFVESFLV